MYVRKNAAQSQLQKKLNQGEAAHKVLRDTIAATSEHVETHIPLITDVIHSPDNQVLCIPKPAQVTRFRNSNGANVSEAESKERYKKLQSFVPALLALVAVDSDVQG